MKFIDFDLHLKPFPIACNSTKTKHLTRQNSRPIGEEVEYGLSTLLGVLIALDRLWDTPLPLPSLFIPDTQ
ncbi:uncharacterized protein PHALS_14332 [Plasmopara halstedii]|uniref:Uncharacterized protein n=1 Tax=Plasmopara halstedii TaxID=4781 RepID=A0A0P1ARY4_PLAHL|nr:uncharacterized protein PHALS_14332 [Plasmopara halstedii]CEG44062.1 hypothetical protein PHALS_14332 [Plasmopara halstedii]|eukprot:XP_024580431.1 hypothetical protein PHALS_14332 [Plasmopara halstedii]